MRHILTDASVRNAMTVHAAFGGSTNLILHIPAIAHAAGLRRPTVDDWIAVNRKIPRLVDVLPNGPRSHPTVQVFLAGGVPEVMLHLRRAGLLELDVLTASGETLGRMLDWWEKSERRARLREVLRERDGVDPDDVIMDPAGASRRGLTSTVTFPHGNLAPGRIGHQEHRHRPERGGCRRRVPQGGTGAHLSNRNRGHRGHQEQRAGSHPARRHRRADVPRADGFGHGRDFPDHLRAPHLDFGKHIAVLTDARFSGVSTGACIGHVTPEALAGGPIGKLLDGDIIEITIDRVRLEGSVNLVGAGGRMFGAEEGTRVLASRAAAPRPGARSSIAGRFPAVGGAAKCERRNVGRMCV